MDGTVVEVILPGIGPADRAEVLQPTGIRRVSGDAGAGVYRTAGVREHGAGVVRELYDWAALTIGGARRALWLFLVPFLMVNVVAWMQPFGLERRWASRLYAGAARLLGLSLTVLAVASFGQSAMDQLVWQCGRAAASACNGSNPAVRYARELDAGGGLVLAALVPLAAVALMAFSARDGRQEYASLAPTVDPARYVEDPRRPLESPGFWEDNRRGRGLACRHLCAGLLTVAVLLTAPAHRGGGEQVAVAVLFTAIGLSGAAVVGGGPWWRSRVGQWLIGAACLLVTAGAVVHCLALGRVPRPAPELLPGMGTLSGVILAVQGGTLLLMALGCLLAPGFARRSAPLYGAAGPALGVVACFVGWVYSTALTLWTRGWLTPDGAEPVLRLPWGVAAVSMALSLLVLAGLVLGVVGVLVAVGVRRVRGPRGPRDERYENALRERALRDAVGRAPKVLSWVDRGLGGLALVLALLVAALCRSGGLGELNDLVATALRLLTELAQVILVGLIAVMMLAVRAMALRPETRRNAGMLWAFGAFWPRAAHPFTPATWTGRGVPELVHRIRHLLPGDGGGRVLVHGHSMGSVLAVLAVWQLDGAEGRHPRLALLTTGCPVRVFFARHYPAFFTEASLRTPTASVPGRALAGWANVWRDTDPLGGPLGLDGVDRTPWQDGVDPTDPAAGPVLVRSSGQPVFPPLQGHDAYRLDPRVDPLREQLVAALRRVPAQRAGS